MKKMPIKKICFTLVFTLVSTFALGKKLSTELNQNYFRFSLDAKKNQVLITKNGNKLEIETLDLKLFETLKAEFSLKSLPNTYVKSVDFKTDNYPEDPAKISLELLDESIEVFTFFKQDEQKYVSDLWINQGTKELLAKKKEILKSKSNQKNISKPKLISTKSAKASTPEKNKKTEVKQVEVNTNLNLLKKKNVVTDLPTFKSKESISSNFRDFRYGAAFVWDYDAELPEVKEIIDISNKMPEYFYPIKDRKFKNDDKEAHLQLIINFYKKRKFGLMNKAIGLYENKYKIKNDILLDYIKANAVLREHVRKKNLMLFNSAKKLLLNIYDRTDTYDLKSGILKYLIQSELNQKNYVNVLDYSKKLFVMSVNEADKDSIYLSSKLVVHSLAVLKQNEKIRTFLEENIVKKIFNGQEGIGYQFYVYLTNNETSKLLEEFNRIEKNLSKPIHSSILFNVAEAYFRLGEYKNALKYYDEYIKNYSYKKNSSFARLRIALTYEILESNASKTLSLYKRVIDLANNSKARYEAKLRYIGLKLCRNTLVKEKDKEVNAFFSYQADEDKVVNGDLLELKWLVRLRSFLVFEEYNKALSYFSTIPLENIKRIKRKVFYLDGSEILHGLIKNHFFNGKHSKVLKVWDNYKNEYNSYIKFNFDSLYYVSFSYLKLDLLNKFEETILLIKQNKNRFYTYPSWVKVDRKLISVNDLLFKKNYFEKKYQSAYSLFQNLNPDQKENPINLLYFAEVLKNLNKKKDAKIILEDIFSNKFFSKFSEKEFKTAIHTYLTVLNKKEDKKYLEKLNIVKTIMEPTEYYNIKDRIEYLIIEEYVNDPVKNLDKIERIYTDFQNNYKNSVYNHKVKYLYGKSILKKNEKKGKEILQKLITEKDVPKHIKELASSELNDLKINI